MKFPMASADPFKPKLASEAIAVTAAYLDRLDDKLGEPTDPNSPERSMQRDLRCIADRIAELEGMPEIVCLIGSTRFAADFIAANLRQTLEGRIVLTIGAVTSDAELLAEGRITAADKIRLDVLHKQKILLADRVLCLNVGNYIGDSTRSELIFAYQLGIPVDFLEPPSDAILYIKEVWTRGK